MTLVAFGIGGLPGAAGPLAVLAQTALAWFWQQQGLTSDHGPVLFNFSILWFKRSLSAH